MKKYQCCIPGCPTYDTAHNFLRFPMDSNWRQQWLAAVPRKNWVIDHSTVVCLKHFKPNELALYTKVVDKDNGGVYIYKTPTPLVKEGAVPSIFCQMKPQVNLTEIYYPSGMFEIEERDEEPETFGDIENCEVSDFVIDFLLLRSSYQDRLKDYLKPWRIISNSDFLLYYTIDCCEVPKILTSIKVDKSLIVSVTLDGRIVDPIDLTWVLPVTGKLNRWSQLMTLLNQFGNQTL